MKSKQASKLKLLYIAFMTAVFTLWSCTKIIVGSYFVKNYRPYIDRIMNKWAARLLSLVKVTTIVKGKNNIPQNCERPLIVMCTHSSLYDMPVAIQALDLSFRFVAKKELYSIPIFGTALKKAEFVSIDRHNHEQAIKDLKEAKEKMMEGITLWMAPEGTRSKDGKLAKFKRGGFHVAIDTQALILPVVIKDIHKVQAGDETKVFTNQTVEVEICESVDASAFSVDDRVELIKIVRSKMLAALGQEKFHDK